jgi:hypothetical protein
MKKQVVNVLTNVGILSALVLATLVTSAQGQSLRYRISANIPFGFIVADKKLPAGKYYFGRVSQESDDSIVSIRGADGRSNAVRFSSPVETRRVKDEGTLVFQRYGDQYFLFQVWPAGSTTGRQLIKSRSEREIKRNLAANSSTRKIAGNAEVETVIIIGVLQ